MIEEEAASPVVRSLVVEGVSSVVYKQDESNHFQLITQLIDYLIINSTLIHSSWHYATIVL